MVYYNYKRLIIYKLSCYLPPPPTSFFSITWDNLDTHLLILAINFYYVFYCLNKKRGDREEKEIAIEAFSVALTYGRLERVCSIILSSLGCRGQYITKLL
jgi:hypothetical protein